MRRLVIVSNRLPINVTKKEEDSTWNFQLSSGGLVSALQGLQNTTKFLWVGWPGVQIDEREQQEFSDELLRQYSALPVFIDQETSELHYNGFSNSTLWPLFHYLPGDIDFNNDQWLGYVRANEMFADKIASLVDDGDTIWIHDYHLMLVPKILRSKCTKNVSIGFFLHVPFPSSDVYRILPCRKEILEGLLASDLIGFHIYDYARHFISSCTRILGVNASPSSVEYRGRIIQVGAYPVGIEIEKFAQCLNRPSTIQKIEELKEKFKGLKVIVGVERLDYIKGLTQKLLALEAFLEQNPEHRGKIVFLQIAVPSRGDVEEYQNLQNQVFELVGRINGKFSTLDYAPVQFIHNSVRFEELVALYHIADVCLITSTRDGMNLVAYEYIASQKQKFGVLILSEFAGAAQSLNGAILINPWSITDIKNALLTALNMGTTEQAVMHSHLTSYVEKFTAARWGASFVEDLVSASQYSVSKSFSEFSENFEGNSALKNIILLTTKNHLNDPHLKDYLCQLRDRNFKVMILLHSIDGIGDFSIRSEQDYMVLPCYGSSTCFSFPKKSLEIEDPHARIYLPEIVNCVLNYYHERCPGSRIVSNQCLIIWDFSESDQSVSEWTSCELQINLEKLICHQPLKVTRDNSCIIISDVSFDFETIQSSIKTAVEQNAADAIVTTVPSHLLDKGLAKIGCPIFKLQIPLQ